MLKQNVGEESEAPISLSFPLPTPIPIEPRYSKLYNLIHLVLKYETLLMDK